MTEHPPKVPVNAEERSRVVDSSQIPAIDSRPAAAVACPCGEEEAVSIIHEAAAAGRPLVPIGGATAISIGNPLRATEWVALCANNLSGITDYSPDDMVITAKSGTT